MMPLDLDLDEGEGVVDDPFNYTIDQQAAPADEVGGDADG